MFENVAPEVRSKRLAYETLPVSIAVHVAALGGGALLAFWSLAFPTQSPRLTRSYVLVMSADPPLPAAVMPPQPAPQPQQLSSHPQYNPYLLVAPTAIPDSIPSISVNRSPAVLAPAATATPRVEQAGGVEGGVVGGATQGVAGGMPVAEDGRVHFGRDKPIPLIVVRRVFPDYPEQERLSGAEATVVVRYVIGTDGWIKELNILQHAKQQAFDDATIKALRGWRFKPLVLEGRAIEVVHELTVFYQLVYR